MPNEPVQRGGEAEGAELAAQSMSILNSLHAAMANFHLYPPASDIVEESVQRAADELVLAISAWGSVTFCELDGKLLINELLLEDREQSRPNTVSFLKHLAMWEVRSITFHRGLKDEELRSFLEAFSRRRSGRTAEGSLGSMLDEGGIEHVKVDEKIYVTLSRDQGLSTATRSPDGEAMDMLRDEVFVRYLVGSASSIEATREEVSELMSDPERIKAAFASVIMDFERSGGEVGPQKARIIRETVDRMYGVVKRLADDKVKETLGEEMAGILAALEPETLVEVLTETAPQAVNEEQMRKEVISLVEGEDVLKLADQVIEKYVKLLAERPNMSPQDYEDISSVLGEVIADLYAEGDARFHPEITRRLRESGLMLELTRSHPQAGREMQVYAIIAEIRSSGSLRKMEGLSDDEVVAVAGKFLDMGEEEMARRIITATSRNLESERADFRSRACQFLKRLHLDFRERGHRAEILDKTDDILAFLAGEGDSGARAGLLDLLGCIANDLFLEGRMETFSRLCRTLLDLAESEGDEGTRRCAAEALSSLNPWDVGRPLMDSLYGEDEDLRKLAASLLPYVEGTMTAREIVERLKGEDNIEITPQLAEVCRTLGHAVLGGITELLDGNAREEVYLRALQLLELMGGNAALSVVRSVEVNPIPAVRAQAMRTMSRMSPGDPSLLPHLLGALSDEEPEVRREAVRGLGTIDDHRSVDSLLAIVQGKAPAGKEEHPRVEEAACMALAKLGPEKAIAPLSDILRKKTLSLRRRSAHPRAKAAACYALGQIGGPEVVELIRGYLDDTDPIVRNEARKALGELRKRGYVE